MLHTKKPMWTLRLITKKEKEKISALIYGAQFNFINLKINDITKRCKLLLKDEDDDDFDLNELCFYFYFNTFQRYGILNFDSATLELNLGALKCCKSKYVLGHW